MAATLPPLAYVDDLVGWLGEPISESADVARAEGALGLASSLVRKEAGLTWVTAGALDSPLPDEAVQVTLACAGRGYTNPEAEVDGSLDDSRSRRIVQEAGLYLTASERSLLASLAVTPHRGLGTVQTTRWDPDVTGPYEDERLLPPWY
jgi:hypothetical protein